MSEKLSSGQLGSIERVVHDLRDDMCDLEYFVDSNGRYYEMSVDLFEAV